jgi:hypothetical protein
LSLDQALDNISMARTLLADVAFHVHEATYEINPEHPAQDDIQRLEAQADQLAHDLQVFRIRLASDPR